MLQKLVAPVAPQEKLVLLRLASRLERSGLAMVKAAVAAAGAQNDLRRFDWRRRF